MDTVTKRQTSFALCLESSQTTTVKAAYLEIGSGPVVLLLHGFLSEANCWNTVTQRLQHHYRCISLDLLGFGNSSKPEIDYKIESQVSFIHQFMKALEIDSFYLMGHSLGGWIAASYALAHPESVLGLTLVAPAGISEELHKYQVLKPLSWSTPIIDGLLRLASPLFALINQKEAFNTLQFYRSQLLYEPIMKAWFRRIFKNELSSELILEDIQNISSSTLIIAAELDQVIPFWYCQTYNSKIPSSQLQIIAGADHYLPKKNGETLAKLFDRFVSSIRGEAPITLN